MEKLRFTVTHETTYQYSKQVGRCYNLAHVVPRNTDRQKCLSNHVTVNPDPSAYNKRQDYFGNMAYYFAVQKQHEVLTIHSKSDVQMHQVDQMPALDIGLTCGQVLDAMAALSTPELRLACEYALDSPMIKKSDALHAYAAPIFSADKPWLSAVRELTQRIYEDFKYDPGFTSVATPLQEVMQHRRGVCQDFAHVAIGCLRSLGYPARYVSGYLETLPPPGQEKLVGADATHAWFAAFSPDLGWSEFDPTNNSFAAEQHIVTAWGRDYSDVTPLRGVIFGGGDHNALSVAVTVSRLDQSSS